MAEINLTEKLELAVDEHLEDVRKEMFEGWAIGEDNIEFVAALIRATYGKGLTDAILFREDVIEWAKDLGYDFTKPARRKNGFK